MTRYRTRASRHTLSEVPLDYLRECFDYDAASGVFKWKVRPEHHYESDGVRRAMTSKTAGKIAGTVLESGYVLIGISYRGEQYAIRGHHLALAFAGVVVPEDHVVDHINGVRSDNRLENLRVLTPSENCTNRTVLNRNNTSGHRGVYRRSSDRWIAKLRSPEGRPVFLGVYKTKEEAINARRKAEREVYGHILRHDDKPPVESGYGDDWCVNQACSG